METMDTINQTFDFIQECNFDQINLKYLVYMKGADLFSRLPPRLQTQTAVFACKENNLNDFSMQELRFLKEKFLTGYKNIRENALQKKIVQYGAPYEP